MTSCIAQKFHILLIQADAELTAISNDASLSIKAKGDKIQAYLTTLPANVKAELEKAQGQ